MGHDTADHSVTSKQKGNVAAVHAFTQERADELLPGILQKGVREEDYYKTLREEGAGFRQTAKDLQAQGRMTSGDLSRSLVGASAGRNPWAASQAGMDAGRQRVRAAIAAAGPRQQGLEADTRYATEQAARLSEGQLTGESLASIRPLYDQYKEELNPGSFSVYIREELMPLADTAEALARLQALSDYWAMKGEGYSPDQAANASGVAAYGDLGWVAG
jgi:hypothetical protein